MAHASSALINPSLTERSELLSESEAVALALAHYDIQATAHKLAGEKDSNFRLATGGQSEYLLKVVNPGENSSVTNMHTTALLHVANRDPGMPVQRVVPTNDGLAEFQLVYAEDDVRTVRLVTFTQGILQRKSSQTALQRRNIGEMLARLQASLADFTHPAEDHFSIWDIKNALSLKPMVEDIAPSAGRDALFSWLDLFGTEIAPQIGALRAQVVHNDLNSDNIVVNPNNNDEIVGIIDFGDMVKTPVLFDLAVAAAYQLTEAEEPLAAAIDFLKGFHARRAILPEELNLLFRTIVVRMAMRIAITEWRAARFPENSQYILRNTPQAWQQFHKLAAISNNKATDMIAQALNR